MWLIFEKIEGIKEVLNLDNVLQILLDKEDNGITFYSNVSEDVEPGIAQDWLFESYEAANECFMKIMEEIAQGAKVFEISFAKKMKHEVYLNHMANLGNTLN